METEILDKIPFNLQPETVLKAIKLRQSNSQFETTVKELTEKARPIARPKAMYKVARVEQVNDDCVDIDGVRFTSRVLTKNLRNLNRVFPCICTCGREIDGLSAPPGDMMQAYCLETIKALALFTSMQFLENHLKNKYALGRFTHMNPGELEDWPITQQKQLFSLFGDTEKLIGVTLSQSCVMIPLKSRSGIYFTNEEGFETCRLCPVKKCPGRRARYEPDKLKEYTEQTPEST